MGNCQINAALHRMALTQARHHPDADAFIQRRTEASDSGKEAVRVLKRQLSDVVSRAMIADYEVSQSGLIPAGQGGSPERAPRWCGAVSFDRDPFFALLDKHNA